MPASKKPLPTAEKPRVGRPPLSPEEKQRRAVIRQAKLKRNLKQAVKTSGVEALFLGERALPDIALPEEQMRRAAENLLLPRENCRDLPADVEREMLGYISIGAPRQVAAVAAGLNYDTVAKWLALGEKGDPDYAVFYARVRICEEQFHQKLLFSVIETDDPRWQRLTWLLERKYPELYATKKETSSSADEKNKLAEAAKRLQAMKERRNAESQ